MITLTCPLCGSDVKAPNAKPYNRLLCKKCHSPFHLSRSGVAVVGAPPDVEKDVEELKRKVREKVAGFPTAKVVGGLAFLLVAWAALSYLLRPADSLKPAAERAAQAFAGDDVEYLKSIAAAGTGDDLARWYEEAHPQLVKQRERWSGKPEAVDIGIAAEDKVNRKGATAFSIHPGAGNARDVSLANPGELTASAAGSFDLVIDWTLNSGGRWEIDGRSTYARVRPQSPEPPTSASAKARATGTVSR